MKDEGCGGLTVNLEKIGTGKREMPSRAHAESDIYHLKCLR